MAEESSFDEIKKSKYNSALAQLYRIDKIWQDAHTHARQIRYAKWNEDLDRAWMEFEDDAKPEDKKAIDRINKVLIKLSIYGINDKIRKLNPKLYNKLILLQKNKLMEKEALLRKIQNHSGKGSAYEESIEDYMSDF